MKKREKEIREATDMAYEKLKSGYDSVNLQKALLCQFNGVTVSNILIMATLRLVK